EERAHFTRGYQQGYLRTAVSPSPTIRLVVAAAGNTARYLVQEQLVGVTLPGQAVGETSAITGAITIDSAGNVISGASKIVVGVAGLKSDRDRRDGYVRGRILEADRYPTVELVPTALHGLTAPLPTSGSDTLTLVGALTIHGVTRPTSWRIVAGFHGEQITGTASTGFSFADCVLTAALTEGPYFVDERLYRSDIRTDPVTGDVSAGVPLGLQFNVIRVEGGACTPLTGVYLDVWHANALGAYSDEQALGTSGEKF